MTFQRRLVLGVSLMVIPALLVGLEAIRSNTLERHALETLGAGLGRSRTYAELETAMFNQGEIVWRFLTGLDPDARKELGLSAEVVDYRLSQWRGELGPEEQPMADQVAEIQRQMVAVNDSVFRLADAGRRAEAYTYARGQLRNRLQPALTALNRQIYRRAREVSVQQAFVRVEEIVENERKLLVVIVLATLALGLASAWFMARSLTRPINELREAMTVVGAGQLEHPIETGARDEIGDLARSFSRMTDQLRHSRTELERLNQELEGKVDQLGRTQAALVQSEKLASIGEMAAAVAHGLRNPLASLRASAQLVLRHPASPAAGEQLQAIIEEVDRLDRRIAHLLTFSRPAAYHPTPEQIGPVIQAVLPGFSERGRSQGVTIAVELPDLPDLPLDRMKLEQVFVELIGNALDAMPTGGRLTIAGRPAADGAGRPGVRLTLTDTGRGIPAETLPSIGQPFFTTRPEGTGLGLATARRFVEQHGGRLDLESRVGTGTTITLWLPREPALVPRSA